MNKAKTALILPIFVFSYLLLLFLYTPVKSETITAFTDSDQITEWEELTTVEDVVNAYPDFINKLMQHINLDQHGLEAVDTAYQEGQLAVAGEALLHYYQENNTVPYLRKPLPKASDSTTGLGDSLQQYIFTFYEQAAQVPKTSTGQLDWSFAGPSDDIEWAWALNRHYHFRSLLQTYQETGNPVYVKQIDKDLKDWVISSLPYPGERSRTAIWRGLEVHFRVKVWANLFYNLMDSEYFSPATRILLLASLPNHGHYLRNFHAQGNWLTMEISALATLATAWPEFKKSSAWLDYSVETMIESMKDQVYPDGVQTELTSHYHRVALNNFDQFYRICQQAGKKLPDYYTNQLEAMWGYLATTIRPTGYGVLNNDSDKTFNRELVLEAANEFGREDWKYISSQGKEGTEPTGGPSFIFPWAGQLVSRNGYSQNAQWSFFDIGPWGSGHQHNDKLHLSVTAFGKDLLVDGGRFAYRGAIADKFRGYARGSNSHNVLLIDGKGQAPGPRVASTNLSKRHYKLTEVFDYAWNSHSDFIDLEGSCEHLRAVFYVRDNYWIVVDHINTDRPRQIDALWHWHPDNQIHTGRKMVVSTKNVSGNLQIRPIGKQKWNLSMVKGQEEPEIQGWYSESYNIYEPNFATIYTTEIDESSTFIWLLLPYEDNPGRINAKKIAQNKDGIKLRIKDNEKGAWDISIPYSNSENAKMEFKGN